jgi:hypothetical protein
LCQLAAQRLRLDVVRADPLAVELHDREPLAKARLQLRVAGDVDLAELELLFDPHRLELCPCPLAEMAAVGVVEDDLGGYG